MVTRPEREAGLSGHKGDDKTLWSSIFTSPTQFQVMVFRNSNYSANLIYPCTGHWPSIHLICCVVSLSTWHIQFERLLMLVCFLVSTCHELWGNLTSLFVYATFYRSDKAEILQQKELRPLDHGGSRITSLVTSSDPWYFLLTLTWKVYTVAPWGGCVNELNE
jgi:hypothetical protein